MSGITAKASFGKLDDKATGKNIAPYYITGQKIGSNRVAMDVTSLMAYEVSASETAGVTSTDQIINLAAHAVKVGDIIRFATGPDEFEVSVEKIIDANHFELSSICSASLVGATFAIMRPITPRTDSSGATLATITPAPLQFVYNGSAVDVEFDSVTPANNRALPVQLVNTTGPINITAGDLNVQLSHSAVQYDSVRIGDGTDLLAINASGEALVKDTDGLAKLVQLETLLTNIELDTTAISADVNALVNALGSVNTDTLVVEFKATQKVKITDGTDDVDIVPLGTQVANADKGMVVNSVIHGLNSAGGGLYVDVKVNPAGKLLVEADVVSSVLPSGAATEVTLAGISNKFNSLGQKASALSAPFVLSTEQETILSAIKTAVELIDNTVNGFNQLEVDLVANTIGIATEATLAAMSAKLPASLGAKTGANSLSVVPASDATFITSEAAKTVSYSENTSIGSGGATTITKPAGAKWCKVYADTTNSANLRIRLSGTATASSGISMEPGRTEDFDVAGDISVIAESGSNQKINIHWGY